MFKPDALAPAQSWQGDPLLSPAAKDAGFLTADWTAVPKVGFERVVFRQLEEQPAARVFDDSVGFELANYERRPSAPAPTQTAKPEFTVDAEMPDGPGGEAAMDAAQSLGDDTPSADASANGAEAAQDSDPATETSPTEQSLHQGDDQAAAEANPIDSAMLAQLREQAFQEGLAQGLAQGHSQGLAQGLAEGEALGKAQGEAEGEARGLSMGLQQAEQAHAPQLQALREQMQAQLDPELALLREVTQRLQALAENPQDLYEPLKRLALHLAEQLVLAELTLSGSAIERLVQRCLDELDLHGQGMVTIELNPQDKARLEEKATDMLKNIQLHGLAQLQPGSVRVLANDTQVEDLVQTRLQALAHSLLGQPEAWREQSAFFKQPLSQRDTEVTDAAAREVTDPRQVVDARPLGDVEHG